MKSLWKVKTASVLFFVSAVFSFSFSQIKYDQTNIKSQFKKHKIHQLNSNDFYKKAVSSRNSELLINLLGFDIRLTPSNIIHPNYKLKVQTENGLLESSAAPKAIPMSGFTKNGGRVAMTFAENFIYGFIREGDNELWIEPLMHYDPQVKGDYYITYETKDLKPATKRGCAALHLHGRDKDARNQIQKERGSRMGCFEVDYAIASDYLMFQKYGSITAVENHNIGVMNNVATNWDDEFADEIQFLIVTQFVSSCSSCDPWTNSTDAGVLLNSFRNWGPGGFGVTHDLGGLWTDRDFDGGTIGIAYLTAVCTGNRYHCLQDFSNNANFKRVLTSHEIGHNFSADHDPSGSFTIMAPTVNSSTSWSQQSINQIQSHYLSRWCLASCGPSAPPLADFSVDITQPCAPGTVQYTDQSQGIVVSRQWSFPGGTPSSSTAQNPVVTYSQPGVYSATLTVSNSAGSDTKTVADAATISTTPTADFSYELVDRTIVLINSSIGGDSYFWEFGDGNTSTQSDPVHTYVEDGDYLVTLTVSNVCGSSLRVENVIVITPPSCNFEGTPTNGCNGMTVNFYSNASNNTQYFSWSFPGGNPSVSDQRNPIVTYESPGTYDVFLTVSNDVYSFSQFRENYISLNADAIADFSYSGQGAVYNFTNLSQNANSYLWNFGDGSTSTETNPTHTYSESGTYQVSLTAFNNQCADSTISQSIQVIVGPAALFTSNTNVGCVSLDVEFENLSINGGDFIEWQFEGGVPTTSTEQNPVVTYHNPGSFDVTLIVGDGSNFDTLTIPDYIQVQGIPAPDFDVIIEELTVQFTNQTINGVSYLWNFGDGTTSNEEYPIHEYNSQNYWIVTLTSENECGENSISKEINTILSPVASFTWDREEICEGDSIQFHDLSYTVIEGRNWIFPGGSPSSSELENPTVIYNASGSYDVILEVSNISGSASLEMPGLVNVIGTPSATIEISGIQGNVINLNDVSSGSTFSRWTLPNGERSEDSSISYVAPANGNYTFELLTGNSCGQSSTSVTVQISAYPIPQFSTSTNLGCAPLEVQFTNESENGEEYLWIFEGGTPATSTEVNPLVSYENSGIYSVTLRVTNQYGTTEKTFDAVITVESLPAIDVDVQTNGFSVRFINNTPNSNSQLWNFGDGSTSSEKSPTHIYTTEGNYTVNLVSFNDCGEAEETFVVSIKNNIPIASFNQSKTVACVPTEVEFKDLSNNNPTFRSWFFEGGTPETSEEESVVVQYYTPGIYFVRLTAGNENGSSTITKDSALIIYDTPYADFSFEVNQAEVNFNYTGNLVESYKWSFGDGEESDDRNPIHVYSDDGVYEVMLTVTNACGTQSKVDTVVISNNSVYELNNLSFQILPNPTNGLTKIIFNDPILETNSSLELYSADGRKLRSIALKGIDRWIWLDTSSLPIGLYFIKVQIDNQFGVKKLVKQE